MVKPGEEETFIHALFSPEGLLGRFVPGYELREDQRTMALRIWKAYKEEHIHLFEAGTGIGKSWAYLIPAIVWACTRNETTVVSTHTIALQEQLMHKDIPFLLEKLGLDVEVVLVKGMGNYFCYRKFESCVMDPWQLSPQEQTLISRLDAWSRNTQEGSASDLGFGLVPGFWEKVSAESSSCSHVECPHFKKCFFFKARKKMGEAKILIVNHYLLMADLVAKKRSPDENTLLPKYERIVVDEAHHLEQVAFESFSKKTSRLDLIRWLGRLVSELRPEKGRLVLLAQDLSAYPSQAAVILPALQIDLPAARIQAVAIIEELFQQVESFSLRYATEEKGGERKESKWRFTPESLKEPLWQDTITPLFTQCASSLLAVANQIVPLVKAYEDWGESLQQACLSHIQELSFIAEYLTQKAEDLKEFVSSQEDSHRVKWMEISEKLMNVTLVNAHLNISHYLQELLFSLKKTGVLCSATLTSAGSFAHVMERIGLSQLSDRSILQNSYPSPFDYASRTLLAVPNDIALPSEPQFLEEAIQAISRAIEVSRGGCFILFTSYDMLNQAYHMLMGKGCSFPVLKQGQASRQALLDRFKASINNVLLGTDSFWEGVDVPGESLRCVVLVKLPFSVPSDPLYEAYSEMYKKEGKDPFMEYSLPQAVLKFKQGYGRLMRRKNDRGCVICLDKRIMTKRYGVHFLKSIPSSPRLFAKSELMFSEMQEFYRKTDPVEFGA